jgi:hypothetical protein
MVRCSASRPGQSYQSRIASGPDDVKPARQQDRARSRYAIKVAAAGDRIATRTA